MKKKRTVFGTCTLIVLMLLPANAFDWPQLTSSMGDFSTYFAQQRNDTFSTGVVYAKAAEVNSADDGVPLVTISESIGMGWFDSPLGNALISINNDDMISVYGNMDRLFLSPYIETIQAQTLIGLSGTSGWQNKESGLEYQLLDNKSKSAINPFILFPQIENKNQPIIRSISAINRNATVYELGQSRSLPAGTYQFYLESSPETAIYKTVVTINGIAVETMLFNQLKNIDTRLYTVGNKNYNFDTVYPGSRKQLVTITSLTRGKTVLVFSVSDIQGNERSVSFTIDVM